VRPITDPRRREEIERYLRLLQTPAQQPPSEAPKPENGPPPT
jgi:hypothetical protein